MSLKINNGFVLRFKCKRKGCGGHTFKYVKEKNTCFCVLCGTEDEKALKKALKQF